MLGDLKLQEVVLLLLQEVELLLVVSNHLTSRATIYSQCHTALRATTYSKILEVAKP